MRRAATLLATAVTFGAVTCGAVIAGIGTSSAAPAGSKDGLRAVGLTSDGELLRFRTGDTDRGRTALPVNRTAISPVAAVNVRDSLSCAKPSLTATPWSGRLAHDASGHALGSGTVPRDLADPR